MGPKYFNFPWKVTQMFGDWDLFVDWYIYLTTVCVFMRTFFLRNRWFLKKNSFMQTGQKNFKTVKLQYPKNLSIEKNIAAIFVFSVFELAKKCVFGPGYIFSVLQVV